MAFRSKLRFLDFVGVLAPVLAIYGFVALLGGIVPLCAWAFRQYFGNKPLPVITEFFLAAEMGSPVPVHWIGLAIALALLALAFWIARRAPSREAALGRLFILASIEWCCLGFVASLALVSFIIPYVPLEAMGENLDFSVMPRFADSFAQGRNVLIYEGLPSPYTNGDLFRSELNAKQTVKMHGFYFYLPPVNLAAADKAALQSMMADGASLISWRGEKQCMAYHPDFAIDWQDAGGRRYDALLCFGCGEVKFYGPGSGLYCDMVQPAHKAFAVLLRKYNKNLPPLEVRW